LRLNKAFFAEPLQLLEKIVFENLRLLRQPLGHDADSIKYSIER
jgi:hypothetical protein